MPRAELGVNRSPIQIRPARPKSLVDGDEASVTRERCAPVSLPHPVTDPEGSVECVAEGCYQR